MAGIGLYGTWYAKANITGGVLTGYQGTKQMGKAIKASFERATTGGDNDLWANNGIAETDAQSASGGTLTITLDRLVLAAQQDLFGLTQKTETVTVDGKEVEGTGVDETGEEQAAAVGVAFIRQHQESNDRAIHEAVIFSYATFQQPDETAQTIDDDGVTWQTPELKATVSGASVTGAFPWRKRYRFPTQAAAEQFIQNYFKAAESGGGDGDDP